MAFYIPGPAELLAYSVLSAVLVPTIIDTSQTVQDIVRWLRRRQPLLQSFAVVGEWGGVMLPA